MHGHNYQTQVEEGLVSAGEKKSDKEVSDKAGVYRSLFFTNHMNTCPPTFAHNAKNNERSCCDWENEIAESDVESSSATLMVSFSEIPGSEIWEPLTDVSWLPTWKDIFTEE